MGIRSSKALHSNANSDFHNVSSTQLDSDNRKPRTISGSKSRKDSKKKSKKSRKASSFKIQLKQAKTEILQQLKDSKRISNKLNKKAGVKNNGAPVVQDVISTQEVQSSDREISIQETRMSGDEISPQETHISDAEDVDMSDNENFADTAFILNDENGDVFSSPLGDDHAASKRESTQNGNNETADLLSREEVDSISKINLQATIRENSLRLSSPVPLSVSEQPKSDMKSTISSGEQPQNQCSQMTDAVTPYSAKRKRSTDKFDFGSAAEISRPTHSIGEMSSSEIQNKPVVIVKPSRQIKSILKKSRNEDHNSHANILEKTTATVNFSGSANIDSFGLKPDGCEVSSISRVVTVSLPEDEPSGKGNTRIEENKKAKSQKRIGPLKSILKKTIDESRSLSSHDNEAPGTSNTSTRLGCFAMCQQDLSELSPPYKKRIVNITRPKKESRTGSKKKMDGSKKTQQAETTSLRKSSRKIKPVERFSFSNK